MNTHRINKTGNFWIDNGIVGLYKIIEKLRDDESFELTTLGLEFSFETDEEFVDLMNQARTEVVKLYLKNTGNTGWIYKDGNFEVYEKTDFQMHLKPFFTGKTPKTEGTLLVPDTKDSELGSKGKRMTDEEFKVFQKFKDNNAGLIIGSKKVQITGKGFLNTPPAYEIGNAFNLSFFEEGKNMCFFSGKKYKHTDVITGMDFPFLTGKSGELNFSSYLEGKPQLSTLYSFVALFSFYNLNYLLQDNMKHYFVLYDSNLTALSEFINTVTVKPEQVSKPDFCNFETEIIGANYEAEALFNFLLSTYHQLKLHFEEEKYYDRLYFKSVFTLSNDGNIFRNVKEYTSITDLFHFFDELANSDEEKNYFQHFVSFVRYFTKRLDSGKYDTTWRNHLCSEILSFKSILGTIEAFLGEVKMKEGKGIPYLDKIIKIYNNKTQFEMKVEMVELCKSLGNRIGAYCREKDDKGILFSIRNAKNRTEFLNVLSETQFRTEVSYSETFFKELPDTSQWEEYKSLVSIFAMNSFLYKDKKTATENN